MPRSGLRSRPSSCSASAGAAAAVEYRAAVLRVDAPGPMPISRLDLPPDDLGFAGAALGTADNATTGSLHGADVRHRDGRRHAGDGRGGDAEAARRRRLVDRHAGRRGHDGAARRPRRRPGARAQRRRRPTTGCAARTAGRTCCTSRRRTRCSPTRWRSILVWKRWNDWFLIEGSHPEDQALAAAYRRAATKFGAEIVEERVFEDTGGARRTDSGSVQVQAQMPAFTQRAPGARRGGRGRPRRASSPRTCPITPGSRGRSPARPGWCPRAGTRRTRPGARPSGRPASRSRRAARRGTRTIRSGWRCGCSARRRRGRKGGDFAAIRDFVLSRPVRPRRLQGPEADLPRLGRPAAPADPADRRHRGRLGLAAGRVPAPGEPARHARDRPAGDGLQAMTGGSDATRAWESCSPRRPLAASPALAEKIFVSNEKGNTRHRARRRDARGHPHHRGDAAAARHHRLAGRQAHLRLRLGRQPGAGLRRRDLRGAAEPALGAGPGALRAAPERQPALHRQRGRQHRHRGRRRDPAGAGRGAGRRRARGHGREPGRQDRGQHLRDHEHGAPDRHRDLRDRRERARRLAGRASPSTTTTAACCSSRPRSAARSA